MGQLENCSLAEQLGAARPAAQGAAAIADFDQRRQRIEVALTARMKQLQRWESHITLHVGGLVWFTWKSLFTGMAILSPFMGACRRQRSFNDAGKFEWCPPRHAAGGGRWPLCEKELLAGADAMPARDAGPMPNAAPALQHGRASVENAHVRALHRQAGIGSLISWPC